ncbi:efflux transporter periplasmic adaptor subunit [Caulobacter flavus]|uniref:Efflux transporter periplasmic adaptor subunit n=1 Tax=Caulobacter flavus TaxID=1679497 RepID=A0A2N5CU85_9CAUL|nr:efflux RND transporter periplasmic adaptor subunit [Caulobacter flavus]AYV47999.1 efflux transporter periplasmic adaptor subunit [Caulobacter flavus]PLR16555.1 efflux transporter periplasmic adaptor subunit [Caulobacter flavus]
MHPSLRKALIGGAAALSLGLAGCGGGQGDEQAPAMAEVTFVDAAASPVQLTSDLPGRVVAHRIAEIRPQVGGLIQRRLFVEGADVKAGAPLFQINAAPFQAELDSAVAALRRAEAARNLARVQVDRLRPLAEVDAVSRQTFDTAVATQEQAEAEVAAARATAQRRRLDLNFATITAPISGRIGASAVTEGALVSQGATEALATVQQIDQVFVDVRQPAARMLELQKSGGSGGASVEILDANGGATGLRGKLLFSELAVDPGTGDLRARVLVDNAGHSLLPGMFVRVRLPDGGLKSAVRLPQQAVFFSGGKAQVMVLKGTGAPEPRPVTAGPVIDNQYVILGGLDVGERVIVEGRDRLAPGAPVKATAWKSAAASQPAAQR